MKLKNKILRYIGCTVGTSLLLALGACADDIDVNQGIINLGADEKLIIVEVPEFDIVQTRAANTDNQVNSLHVFVLDGDQDASKVVSHQEVTDYTTTSTGYSFGVRLSGTTGSTSIFIIANGESVISSGNITNNTTLSQLRNLSQSLVSNKVPVNGMLMASPEAVTLSESGTTVKLDRVPVKISMELNSEVTNFKLSGFKVCQSPNTGLVGAPSEAGEEKYENLKFKNTPAFVSTNKNGTITSEDVDGKQTVYTYPTLINGRNEADKAYMIVWGKFGTDDYDSYYRLEFLNNEEVIDLAANHYYQIELINVAHKGYSSEAEANKYPESKDIDYKIYDHSANVLSMVTDGVRELGVTAEVIMTTGNNSEFTVKVFSGTNQAAEQAVKPKIEIIEGKEWITVPNANNPDAINANVATSGKDETGARWKYQLSFVSGTNIYNDKTAVIRVTWQGLSRDINVSYNADFKPEEICMVELSYGYIGGTTSAHTQEPDYWDFLKNIVKGASPDDMADGLPKNEGLHFPMPFGASDSQQWTYTYTFNFSKNKDGGLNYSSLPVSVDFDTKGDAFFAKKNLTWEKLTSSDLKYKLTLKSPEKYDYTYATGTLNLTLKYNNGDDKVISMSLYHTGFFHYNSGGTGNCLYYEVKECGNKKYWLDRNIGATSNKMFVDNGDGNTNSGKSEARGLFYKIFNAVEQGKATNESARLCPPGYVVPNKTDWDDLRLSTSFTSGQINEGSTTYVATYYNTGHRKQGNVYFPKGRFYNSTTALTTSSSTIISTNEVNSGDNASGYYWTSTEASGLEKNEIGCWLNALNLVGNSNTYIAGSIKFHEMNVRCIASQSHSAEQKFSIDFNVKGATHVYLYKVDENGRSGIFTFPGKAIGSQSAVDNLKYSYSHQDYKKSYLHFSYVSTIPDKDLYVFFAYVTDSGKIRIISENGEQSLDKASGWPVKIGYNYFFNSDDDSFDWLYETSTSTTFPWAAEGSSSKDDPKDYYFKPNKKITIYWKKDISNELKNMYQIKVYYEDGTQPYNTDDGYINQMNPYNSMKDYYNGAAAFDFSFTPTKGHNTIYVKFRNPDVSSTHTSQTYKIDSSQAQGWIDYDGNNDVFIHVKH